MSEALPEGWATKPLGELAQIISGGTPSRNVADFWEGGTIPWVTPTDITATHGKYISDSKDRITKLGLACCSASLLPPGSILMTSRATLGEAKISLMPACTNQGFKSLVAKPGVSNEFLYYQIQRTKQQYARFGSGSTFLEVGKKDTAAFPVMIPEEASQAMIGKLLSLIDTQIEATEGLIAKQERVRAGLMQDLFTRGVDEHGQLRPPRHQAPHLYHQTELGSLPVGWEVDALKNLAATDITYGIVQAGPHVIGGIPYIRTGDMSGDALNRESLLCTSPMIAASFQRSRVQTGEIVIAIRATIGKALLVPPELDGANLTQGTARFAANERLDRRFALRMLRCRQVEQQISIHTKGTAFSEITLGDLRTVIAPFARDPKEQQQIAWTLDASDNRLDQLKLELSKLRLQKTGLMQDLLTGKVSVAPLLESLPA